MRHYPKRGEIWWADMGTGVGSEQQGPRPVLIIQNDVGNVFSPTVIVAAITDAKKKHLPTHIQLGREHGLPKNSVVMLEQIRTLDKKRLNRRVGELSQQNLRDLNSALQISVGLAEAVVL